jgi:hypothetical protein
MVTYFRECADKLASFQHILYKMYDSTVAFMLKP